MTSMPSAHPQACMQCARQQAVAPVAPPLPIYQPGRPPRRIVPNFEMDTIPLQLGSCCPRAEQASPLQ